VAASKTLDQTIAKRGAHSGRNALKKAEALRSLRKLWDGPDNATDQQALVCLGMLLRQGDDRPPPGALWAERPTETWYNSHIWKKRARRQLTLQPLCEVCLGETPEPVTIATVADHCPPASTRSLRGALLRELVVKV
jgi:hypothetical protein